MWEGRPLDALIVGGGGEEDRFSHGLAALLEDDSIMAAFLRRCCNITSSANGVSTQVGVQGGRADICIVGPSLLALVEIKVGASLHGQQITTYAKHVIDQKGGRLFLLAPSRELAQLIQSARSELQENVPGSTIEPISWAEVRDLFEELGRREDLDRRLRVYLTDFATLISKRIENDSPPFTGEELAMLSRQDVPLITARLEVAIDDAAEILRGKLGGPPPGASAGRGFYGRWVKHGGYSFWFGYYPEAWARSGISPFWVQCLQIVPGWDALAASGDWQPSKSPRHDQTLVALSLPDATGAATLAVHLAGEAERIIRKFADCLKGSGTPALEVTDGESGGGETPAEDGSLTPQ